MKTKERTLTLSQALKREAEESKGKPKGVDKRFTSMKTAAATKDAGTGTTSGVMEPTSEELAQINEFTRSPKQAHEVVVFSTLSCNDIVDRDDEKFTTETVDGFATLESPFGPVGKSYMTSHDYSKLPVGRIFDASAETIEGSRFLKNKVYIPNTDANKSLIEGIDFGVNWAVSVGVMLEASECGLSFCGAQMFNTNWGSWCYEGHDKGFHYIKDGETDSWGYPEPVDPKTPGAEKCIGLMKGAKDFYELSQVFLGAQFYAALEKQPGFKGVIKAASAVKVPLLGLSRSEAKAFEDVMPHLDPRAAHALKSFGATWDEDGLLNWTDDQKLVWTYSPEDSEVLCLGKNAEDDSSEDDTEGDEDGITAQEQSDGESLGEDDLIEGSGGGGPDDSEGDETDDGGLGSGSVEEGDGSDGDLTDDSDSSDEEDDSTDEDKEKAVSKAAVLKSLKGLKAPATVLSAVEGTTGDSLDAALSPLLGLIKSQDGEITNLKPKAVMGDEYLKSLRSDAIEWYVRANAAEGKGVNTDNFTKMLDAAGESVDLIKGLTEMQKTLAQAKFPTATRRSSFPSDANSATAPADVDIPDVKGTDKTVSRLHG